ncbi:hypothetical protein ScalyP_jg2283 [Parmales sp. scaly parma]|nr:hypothetical protein ScalyP_jg2283 [Parmales sp. scaly parma]
MRPTTLVKLWNLQIKRTPLEQKGQGAAEIHLPGVHEHGGCEENPEVDIKFPGGTLTLSTWREIKQLDFVRHCLQSGFLGEMSNNETLLDSSEQIRTY